MQLTSTYNFHAHCITEKDQCVSMMRWLAPVLGAQVVLILVRC